MGRHCVEVVQLLLRARLVCQGVVVEVNPLRLIGRARRGQEGVVFDVLAEVLERDTLFGGHVPKMTHLLVGDSIATV